MFNGEGFEAA